MISTFNMGFGPSNLHTRINRELDAIIWHVRQLEKKRLGIGDILGNLKAEVVSNESKQIYFGSDGKVVKPVNGSHLNKRKASPVLSSNLDKSIQYYSGSLENKSSSVGQTCVPRASKQQNEAFQVNPSSCAINKYGTTVWEGCRDNCCIECAVQIPNILSSPQACLFQQKLKGNTKEIKVVTVGNSVARYNDYRTIRQFLETMELMHPTITWKTDLKVGVNGGRSQEGMYSDLSTKKSSHFHNADVIIIQYSIFASCRNCIYAEELLRTFLELKSKPLVLMVEHVAYGGLYNGNYTGKNGSYAARKDVWERIKQDERGLALHYNLPFVSMSAALNIVLLGLQAKKELYRSELMGKYDGKGRCLGKGGINKLKTPDFKLHWKKYYSDNLHFSALGNAIAGCLLADVANSIASATSETCGALGTAYRLPPPFLEDTKQRVSENHVFEFVNSTAQRTLFPLALSKFLGERIALGAKVRNPYLKGFRFKQGGKGGEKIWLNTMAQGAILRFTTPKPCTQIRVEYYKHHELGMGMAEVKVDGKIVFVLDACCKKTCVDNGDGIKRGFYYVATVAENLERKIHNVEIKTIKRTSNVCETSGNQFDIVSIMGNTKSGGDHCTNHNSDLTQTGELGLKTPAFRNSILKGL